MIALYAGFLVGVVALLALDLGVLRRGTGEVGVRAALGWTAAWVAVALAFAGFLYAGYEHGWLGLGTTPDASSQARAVAGGAPIYNDGRDAVIKYLTGFAVEKALAIDNVFVIATIFAALGVPPALQRRVLTWGIVGALVMRGAMIGVGAALLHRFGWLLDVFGVILVLTGVKLALARADATPAAGSGGLARLVRRWLPVTQALHGERFWVRAGRVPADGDRALARARPGARVATPLLLALILVEASDAIFAADSIPAIFAITTDPFLVFTSNVLAMLGLRSLYFALAAMIARFRYLQRALAVVLVAIGAKLLAHDALVGWLGGHLHVVTMGLIAAVLAGGVAASVWIPPRAAPAA